MKKHGLLLILSASLLGLAACGGGSSTSSGTSSNSGTSVTTEDTSSAATSSEATTSEGGGSKSESSEGPVGPEAANGAFSYVYEDYAERTKILGALEKYAVDNKLTGLTAYGDGGYVMYNPVVVKGSNSYIPGYGFGILPEGELSGDLEGEANPAYKRYYHIFETEDPAKINYMNDKGSVVGDLIGYVNATYFGTRMNETKDGYEWVKELATVNRPIAVDADAKGYALTYKFPVKVGADFRYTINTENPKYTAFNNREVALEDYITTFKIFYTQKFGMARGNENLKNAGSIAGSQAYYDASADGINEAAWNNIGIKAYVDPADGKSYLEFKFNNPTNRFYAMYYLSSTLYAPVPADFINALGDGDFARGVANWGVGTDTESIVDHWLCTGAYAIEKWETNSQIVFKKNPNFADGGRYKIPGIHVNILPAASTDPEAAFKEFLANKLHGSGIPSTQLEQYKNDPRTTVTDSDSTYKFNMNTCTQDVWDDLFGVNGSIDQIKNPSEAWDCEPAMANKNFTSGISFALDRKTIAEKLGRTPSCDFFGNGYFSDPEEGIVYNKTQEHKDAMADLVNGTDGYGYSLEKAKASFLAAAEELIEEGVYNSDDTITIEIAWQTQAQITQWGEDVKTMLESAFNTEENPLKLEVEHWVGAKWSDVYYDKMMVGQYDIGFGSVSGNGLNPLNFLEVLKSDNSSEFTLNWGLDTNVPSEDLVYDGKYWSFDALWTAADQGTYVVDGANAPLYEIAGISDAGINADGSATFVCGAYTANVTEGDEIVAASTTSALAIFVPESVVGAYTEFCMYDAGDGKGELEVVSNKSGVTVAEGEIDDAFVKSYPMDGVEVVTVTFPADVVNALNAMFAGEAYQALVAGGNPASGVFAIDFYADTYLLGKANPGVYAGYDGLYAFPAAE